MEERMLNPLLPQDVSLNLNLPQPPAIRGLPKMARPRRRSEVQRYASPSSLQSSAEMVGEAGLNTLSAIGNLLDVPASITRDLVWNAGQLLKPTDRINPMADMVNPFDQIYSSEKGLGALFSSDNRKEHRETFRHFGLASEEDTWGNFAADLALDVVTDPLTYMTFGGSAALKSGGTVAKKAGLLGKLGKKTISYVDDAGQEVVEQLGKRRALQETTLKELYKPASDTGDEVLDIFKEDISKNVTDFMRKRDEASDALDSLIRDGSPRPGALEAAQDALEVADGNLVAAQQEYAQRLAKGQDRLLEIEDAKRIEDAAGFDRKGLTEKYGADSPEFKAAHQEFVQQLRGRMDTGDLAGSLGGTVGLVNPITGKALVMDDYIPGAKLWAKSLDTSMGWLARTYPARFGRMLFDSKASGNLEAGAQELATKLHGIKRESEGLAGELAFVGKDSISANLRKIRKDFDEILGSDLDVIRETGDKFDMKAKDGYIQLRSNAEIAESIFHHVRERSSKVGLEEAFDEATSRLIPAKISKDKIEKLGDVVRSTMDEYGATLNKLEDQSYAEVLATGIKGQLINHEAIAHAARMTGENLVRTDPATGRLLKTSGASTASRDPEIAHIPEVFVSQILSDPDLRNVIKQAGDSKAVTEQLANAIMDKYSKVDGILDPNYQPKGKQARADRLAKWVGRNKHKPWFASQLDKWVETLATENVMSSDKLDSLLNFQKHMHDYLAEAKAGKAAGDPRLQKMYEENIKPLAEKISKEAEGIAFSHKLAHARDLAKYVYTHENDSIFSLDRLKNSRAYLESNFNLARMGKGANEYIAANMARAGDVADGIPVKEALEQAGFEPEIAASYITGLTGVGVEDLDDFVLPTRNAKALTSVMKAHKAGQWQNSLLEFADAITNTWKAGMTVATVKGIPLFPSFFTRNGVSGQFVNVSSGHIPLHKLPEYARYVRKWQKKLGQPDISEDEILQMALAHGVIGHAQGMDDAVNLTSSLPPTLTQYVKGIMGMDKGTLEKVNELTDELVMRPSEVGKMVEKLPGGRKGRKIMAESAAWGGVLNSHVEYMNRMPMFAWLVDNGWSPKAAADEVKRLQFDYSDLSPVEKNVFKRLMPFYTFSRKAAELTVDTLMRHPGGILSKTIRQAGKESSTDATTPGYLKEQTSIDITDGIPFLSPELKDGTRRYITSMGLPYEDVARLMPFDLKRLATGDVPGSLYRGSREVARSLGSRLHPGITFGIEEMTGRDLYRDQPIAASARPIGETISALAGATGVDVSSGSLPLWAERAASKSPFSRAIGLGRNVARATEAVATGENVPQHASKMASTILPFRITDVSPQAQSYALRENTVDLLKERGWGREAVYTPHSLLDLLSPEDRENALRANALLQHQRRQSSLGRPVNILNRQ